MSKVIHFELFAEEPDRASDFYSEVFGWLLSKKTTGNEDYWLIATGREENRGINGGMKQRTSKKPGMIPTIQVDSLDAMIERVLKNGGKLLEPKKALVGTGYLAYCEDTEGNTIALLEYNHDVK